MKVSKGKAYATLTDVKNLIGDVFAMVDKRGQVIITSYNKPKYIIKTYTPEQEAEDDKNSANKSEPKDEIEPQPAEVVVQTPEVKVEIEEPTAVPVSGPSPVEREDTNYESEDNPFAQDSTPVQQLASRLEENGVYNEPQPTEERVLANISDEELWDRSSAKEQKWVQKARDLI